ncbi:hypothetical protein HYH03_005378 [Edaphochlamys debaryana]|uniref:F-box domain-containing protein n=1 Tax=Edaphochlamys debaryana TaxID=47281 RepID=A0A836C1A9_9CHLO|nr:hypothetical protein HYH03_005378 [Edaphochlamys debaryana]|eukprot:KAG2496555.1 hypothetical protein HYH03_005378 [Edaphochlamys debaryana]
MTLSERDAMDTHDCQAPAQLQPAPQLQPEIMMRIASFLSPSEVACSLRVLSKATARLFPPAVLHFSKPVPTHAFATRWLRPGATRILPLARRRQLLHLTAASGVVANLEVAATASGVALDGSVLEAAARAGSLEACTWLRNRGCPWGPAVTTAAARSGCMPLVYWLISSGCPCAPRQLLTAAGESGNAELVEWLLSQDGLDYAFGAALGAARGGHGSLALDLLSRPMGALLCAADFAPASAGVGAGGGGGTPGGAVLLGGAAEVLGPAAALLALLEAGAQGLELGALQELHARHVDPFDSPLMLTELGVEAVRVVAAAVASPTGDWAAKTEWLLERGYPRSHRARLAAAQAPDAAPRLAWLAARGFPSHGTELELAGRRGDVAALRAAAGASGAAAAGPAPPSVRSWLPLPALRQALLAALRGGHVKTAAWLEACLRAAASQGHTGSGGSDARSDSEAEDAAVGEGGVEALPGAGEAAAESGSVPTMLWLAERGVGVASAGSRSLVAAVAVGCERALDYLVAHGCELEGDGHPYVRAGEGGDLATLRWLRRNGCPWSPRGDTLVRAIAGSTGTGGGEPAASCAEDGTAAAPTAQALSGLAGSGRGAGGGAGGGGEAGGPGAGRRHKCCCLAVLRWLEAEQCPVDWDAALRAAARRRGEGGDEEDEAVRAWVRAHHAAAVEAGSVRVGLDRVRGSRGRNAMPWDYLRDL